MAYSFSANQFEDAFSSKRLGNWELPLRHPERPRARSGTTRVIADDRGHLLPGVRHSRDSPWGRGPFTAWDQPRRVTRAYAEQMEAESNKRYVAWLKRSAHVPLPQQQVPPTPDLITPVKSSYRARKPRSKPKPHEHSQRPTRQSSAHSTPVSSLPKPPESLSEIKAVSPPASISSRHSYRPHTPAAPGSDVQPVPPAPSVCSEGLQVARGLADESRSHQPLPDTVHDPIFCGLQARRAPNPGLALPPPRPPSGETHVAARHKDNPRRPRPNTTSHPLRRITEMDLAIRWDLRLANEKHPSNSASKVAPAVFNVVAPTGDCGLPGGCNTPPPPPVAPRSAWGEVASPKPGKENSSPNVPAVLPPQPQRSSNSTPSAQNLVRRSRSTPNLARRPCVACDSNSKPPTAQTLSSAGYKQAFKAGSPSNFRPHTAMPVPKQVIVPKPRKPFSKRSYSIATLAPPFSLWPDGSRSQDYPDHWRLASVYQHAYKAPEMRRKPLLASVFQ